MCETGGGVIACRSAKLMSSATRAPYRLRAEMLKIRERGTVQDQKAAKSPGLNIYTNAQTLACCSDLCHTLATLRPKPVIWLAPQYDRRNGLMKCAEPDPTAL